MRISLIKLYFSLRKAVLFKREEISSTELINDSVIVSEDADWITRKKSFNSEGVAISEILKFSPNVVVLQPVNVVSGVTAALSRLHALHG